MIKFEIRNRWTGSVYAECPRPVDTDRHGWLDRWLREQE